MTKGVLSFDDDGDKPEGHDSGTNFLFWIDLG